MTKVNIAGGMTSKVYNKLYTSMIEPILMYGSGVWGTKTFSVISSVQHRACKYFLSVGKHMSNVSSRGDMGWTSCYTKQSINVCRLLCRTLRSEDHRLSYQIYKWISRRRKGWAFEMDKIVNTLNVRETIYNLSFSTKSVMKTVSEKNSTENFLTIDVMGKTETNCVHIDFINMMLKVGLMCFKIYLDLKDGLWPCFGPALSR
jgi:hypothetical protein